MLKKDLIKLLTWVALGLIAIALLVFGIVCMVTGLIGYGIGLIVGDALVVGLLFLEVSIVFEHFDSVDNIESTIKSISNKNDKTLSELKLQNAELKIACKDMTTAIKVMSEKISKLEEKDE